MPNEWGDELVADTAAAAVVAAPARAVNAWGDEEAAPAAAAVNEWGDEAVAEAPPIDPLDDFDEYNRLEDEKEARGYDPNEPGLASRIWTGVKGVVSQLPAAAKGAATIIAAPGNPALRAEAGALATQAAGKVLGSYNMLGKGAERVREKTGQAIATVLHPDLEPEIKKLSRRGAWEFEREARDTENFTNNFNQHLETIFPEALKGLGSVPVDNEAAAGLSLFADPANYVPTAAAARWTTQVPLRGAVRAASSAAREAARDVARAQAERESLALMRKPGMVLREQRAIDKQLEVATKELTQARVRQTQAREALQATVAGQREVLDGIAAQAGASLAERAVATGADVTGRAAEVVGGAANWLAGVPEKFARFVTSGADPSVAKSVEGHLSNVAGGFGVWPATAGATGIALSRAGKDLRIFGRVLSEAESQLPFFKRLSRELSPINRATGKSTRGISGWAASLVDQSGMGELVGATGRVAADASRAVPLAALMGYVGAGGDLRGAAEGTGGGMVFGLAGAGYGQWRRFKDPATFRAQQIGDVERYRKALPTDDVRKFYDALPGGERAAVATMQLAHPDLRIQYSKLGEGKPSFYYAAEDGPVAVVNLDTKDPLAAVLSHEIGHHVERHGMSAQIEQVLLGDPLTNRPGIYTELDGAGKPIVGPDGRYVANEAWQKLKQSYDERLRALADKSGEAYPARNDAQMAGEVFAEHVSDYLLGRDGDRQLGRDLRSDVWSRAVGSIADSSLVAGVPMLRQIMGKLGVPLTAGQKVVHGSGLFPGGTPASGELRKLISQYHRKSASGRTGVVDDETGGTRYTAGELAKYPQILDKLFDGSDDVARDPRGRVMRNKDGSPRFLTAPEQKAQREALAGAISQWFEKQQTPAAAPVAPKVEPVKPEATAPVEKTAPPKHAEVEKPNARFGTMDIGGKPVEGWITPWIPDALLDELAGSGKFNGTQIEHLRQVSKSVKEGKGQSVLFFYQPATKQGSRYQSLSGDWRTEAPQALFISKAGNVYWLGVSREKLMAKAQDYVTKGRAQLWDNSLPALVGDIDTYLANHAAGRAGSDAIGVEKKDAINALFEIGTKTNMAQNPLIESKPGKGSGIIRSRRIDRVNRLSPVEEFFPVDYDKVNRNLRPERASTAAPAAVPEPAARTLEQRQAEWRTAAEKIAPGVMERFRLEFGSPDEIVRRGRASRTAITGAEEAAYLPAEKMLFLFDEALKKRSEMGTMINLLHEIAHAHHDTLPAERQAELLDQFRAETRDRTGPLFVEGKLRRGVARGVETDPREWYAERLAFANREWAQRRKNGAPGAGEGLVGQLARQYRDFLRRLVEWIEEIRGEKVDVDFREFLDAAPVEE